VSGRESYAADMLHCALLVANRPLEPSSPDYEECTSASALPSDTPTALRKNWPQFFTAYYLADKVSLMSSVYTHRYDSVDHQRLGAMPLVVLSAEYSWGKSGTPEGIWYKRSYSKIWIAMHEALAHLSSRGVHRIIKGSGHTIQLDKPQAVINAVDEVLREPQTGGVLKQPESTNEILTSHDERVQTSRRDDGKSDLSQLAQQGRIK
jgi:pimeloyl-ACP methyl ester carboxylesterase